MPAVATCVICNKNFPVRPARLKKGTVRYCSMYCLAEARKGERKPELRRNCLVCGNRFLPNWGQRNKNQGKYCSLDCYNKIRNSDIELICDFCGKTYIRKAYIVRRK